MEWRRSQNEAAILCIYDRHTMQFQIKETLPKHLLLRNKRTSNVLFRPRHAVLGMDVDNKKPK
jgi:hypothetical protein